MPFRRPFLLSAFVGLFCPLAPVAAAAAATPPAAPPNIVFILADDLGYGDVGSYGQQLIRTPRLDRMAAEGLRFTQAYAGAPSCAPSRCVFLTGLHTGHARIRANSDRPLQAADVTVTEALKSAGYATGVVGKWGLGLEDSSGAPWRKGVDDFLGYLDQTHAHTHYPDYLWANDRRREIPENKDGARRVYSHDLFADAALDFIRRHRAQPFFLYAAFTLPHAEVDVPADGLADYRGRWPEPKAFPGSKTYIAQKEPRAVRAAMISRLDRDVGRLLDLLDELKLSANTLVVFTSDNGPITAGGQDPEFFDSNGPLRDLKFTLWEGGIRVPFLARWPGRIAPGVSTHVADFADLFPTFADLARAAVPAGLDGVSIVPTLLGRPAAEQRRRPFHYWEAAPLQALRQDEWKLVRPAPEAPAQLYHLGRDLGETTDLAATEPAVAARLTALLNSARTENPDFPLQKKARKQR